jgi:hypothetical protein
MRRTAIERHFVAIDPGGTTGLAVLHTPADRPPQFTVAQFKTWASYSPETAHLAGVIRHYVRIPGTVVVVEDFSIRNVKAQGANRNWGLQPVAITAALQGFLLAYDLPTDDWQFQTAGLAMSSFPDQRLMSVAPIWIEATRGQGHARDAVRHLLTYLKLHEPQLFQAAKTATPRAHKTLQTGHKRPRRSAAC